jgi:hypothetical protein
VTHRQYFRLAVWLPLALPMLAAPPILLAERIIQFAPWLVAFSFYLVGGVVLYGVPYTIVAIVLYRRIAEWPARRTRLALWIVPGGLSLVAPLVLIVLELFDGSPRWWDGSLEIWLAALATGYGYATVITLLGWLLVRNPDASGDDRPTPSQAAA